MVERWLKGGWDREMKGERETDILGAISVCVKMSVMESNPSIRILLDLCYMMMKRRYHGTAICRSSWGLRLSVKDTIESENPSNNE